MCRSITKHTITAQLSDHIVFSTDCSSNRQRYSTLVIIYELNHFPVMHIRRDIQVQIGHSQSLIDPNVQKLDSSSLGQTLHNQLP
ncbi:hypothetical protein TSUD_260510 [Trifolium subterraneum]|uniref:Uncharacterized protein n=1 Tax=Trifolium subterraneum TaxID=3900 RepID=A0A2Z6NYC4_TRISU|nr:hypothetical protein TSUD_260510 [Trifolium subterraneum]